MAAQEMSVHWWKDLWLDQKLKLKVSWSISQQVWLGFSTELKMTRETPEVRSNKRKPREKKPREKKERKGERKQEKTREKEREKRKREKK